MMLAAPEFVIAERVELLDEIEVAAELQHRMLADRVVRGEESSEFEARHLFPSGGLLFCLVSRLRAEMLQGNRGGARRPVRHGAMRAADGSPAASPAKSRDATVCPTGKSLLIFRNHVKPRLQKYFCFLPRQISSLIRPVSFRQRGVAHVINVGRDAVDAAARETNAVCYVRRSRVVPTPQSLASSL